MHLPKAVQVSPASQPLLVQPPLTKEQFPPLQVAPGMQWIPHDPQLPMFVLRSMQAPPQQVSANVPAKPQRVPGAAVLQSGVGWQLPRLQKFPAPQSTPQPPQLAGSWSGSLQVPPQQVPSTPFIASY
jgi:hypothetical protein